MLSLQGCTRLLQPQGRRVSETAAQYWSSSTPGQALEPPSGSEGGRSSGEAEEAVVAGQPSPAAAPRPPFLSPAESKRFPPAKCVGCHTGEGRLKRLAARVEGGSWVPAR